MSQFDSDDMSYWPVGTLVQARFETNTALQMIFGRKNFIVQPAHQGSWNHIPLVFGMGGEVKAYKKWFREIEIFECEGG